MNLLFLCVANSARSQLAEGLARAMFGPAVRAESAGSEPCGFVRPKAIEVLREIGIDITHHRSKAIADLDPEFLRRLDFVITLCAEEICPVWPTNAGRLHWPVPDPARAAPSEEAGLAEYRRAMETIRAHLEAFGRENNLPLASGYHT